MAVETIVQDNTTTARADENKIQSNLTASAADSDAEYAPEKMPASADEAQEGVREVEAVTLTWTRTSLIVAFVCMWSLYLTNAFQGSITNNLSPFITSGFEEHSLLTVIYIVSSSMAAAVYIPVAKIVDVWGRAEGFLLLVGFATLGLVLSAVTTNLTTYCAAQVFYTIGFSGMIYCVDVITADSSSLKHRGLAFAFTASPYMISAFAGPKSAEAFYENTNWRWGYGCFAIILPFVAAPLAITLKYNLKRARAFGVLVNEKKQRTFVQTVWYYIQEFDAAGMILLASGLVIFLLPFTLADSAPSGWSTGYIIAMLVLGLVLLITFALHERFFARQPFVPFKMLTDRSVLATLGLAATYQISYYCWSSYFTSFLQVVTDLTIAQAGYVSSTFDVISGVLLIGVGLAISKTGYFKWLLWIAVPLYIFGQGLMIYFRKPGVKIGYIVMCQIFLSIGGSTMILCEQIAILAAVDHQQIAAALALLSMCGWISGAIGSTISGAIWTNSFPQALSEFLPEDAQASLEDIYGSLDVQLGFEVGSATRLGIQWAYGVAQERMLIAGTAIMTLSLVCVFFIRNYNVGAMKQTKGMVF
ncbi:hypothetical protein LTR64_003180 [Lithohypha guttulata]|uniref:uncharacterized protein n=1 Tax=Lithohypha guttulata TaxID=1690604 RepID=UPI002DE1740E|nr:hypothetical protein LTR51_000597 [Lithohypha guttulata]